MKIKLTKFKLHGRRRARRHEPGWDIYGLGFISVSVPTRVTWAHFDYLRDRVAQLESDVYELRRAKEPPFIADELEEAFLAGFKKEPK